ncbi:hypothetical protein BDP81DRAFT_17920 [Colletotrichum phormii]|uniref:Uncharacterized protein n=1 Tax=Colletotrichum phormii TaxID=359342 RepID=A0AAJ0EP50_9PEZI|nr:uncharacterized protein BDP81DRAFT_17920 [Colletotrichum phormii]KAK1656254.1 hypothetical protein BDP81DRAFT_17920 [Colletotrichum phormii]
MGVFSFQQEVEAEHTHPSHPSRPAADWFAPIRIPLLRSVAKTGWTTLLSHCGYKRRQALTVALRAANVVLELFSARCNLSKLASNPCSETSLILPGLEIGDWSCPGRTSRRLDVPSCPAALGTWLLVPPCLSARYCRPLLSAERHQQNKLPLPRP